MYTLEILESLGGTGPGSGVAVSSTGQAAGQSGAQNKATLWSTGSTSGTALPNLAGWGVSSATGFGPSGQVVGWARVGANNHAVVFDGSTATDLGTGPGFDSDARAMNSSGTIVGNVTLPSPGTARAALYSNGAWSLLSLSGNDGGSSGLGINDSGLVIGSHNSGGVSKAVKWASGAMSFLTSPAGTTWSQARALNNAGLIVGQFRANAAAELTPITWSGSTSQALGLLPGLTRGVALGVNDTGTVVGSLSGSTDTAVAWNGSQAVDLNTRVVDLQGMHLNLAWAINPNGVIVGEGNVGQTTRAFRLTPVPEPASVAGVLVGIACLRRRRKHEKAYP